MSMTAKYALYLFVLTRLNYVKINTISAKLCKMDQTTSILIIQSHNVTSFAGAT